MTRRSWSMQSLPTAGRWSIYVALAVLFAITCAYLSHWQFSRNAERSAQLELVANNYDAAPLPIGTLLPAGAALDPLDEWHPVELRGTYLPDQQLLARNRPQGGTVAYEVLTPLLLDDGRIFIVDRGWVPPGASSGSISEIPDAPTGTVTVIARLREGEALPPSGRGAPEGQVPTINLPLIAGFVGDRTITAAYGNVVSETPAAAGMPNPIDPPVDDPGPYLSYAVQWILFAIMGFVFIGYVIRTEIMHRREERAEVARNPELSPEVAAETVARRHRERRRLDRDMLDEDEILDSHTPSGTHRR